MGGSRSPSPPSGLELELSWTPVLVAVGEPYRFPEKVTKFLRTSYYVPGIYCWRIERPRVGRAVYIGETECLARRLGTFLGPRRREETDERLKELFRLLLPEGAEIGLEMLWFAPFTVNGYEVTMERLGSPHVRRLMENMAIVSEMALGSIVLNRGRELIERQKARLFPIFRQLPRGKRKEFLQFLKTRAGKTQL